MIREGVVGEVLRVFADTSHGEEDPEAHFGTEHRIVNPQLAGGVLLDSTLYSLTWCFQTLYHTQPASSREPPCKTSAQVEVYPATGTDEAVTILLTFPRSVPHGERRSQAVATGSLRLRSNPGKGGADDATPELPCARIQGTKGEIAVYGMCWQPRGYKVVLHDQAPGTAQYIAEEFPGAARGMNWEADEVARCIRDGKLESDTMGWEESLAMMDTFDEIRRQAGLVFPAAIETTELA
ncbi:hypothetical protein KEM52_003793 [Ascosphaera acerosa]|nr:hypothetical protein KEM52_003793 [Ascosphaera acerosa]